MKSIEEILSAKKKETISLIQSNFLKQKRHRKHYSFQNAINNDYLSVIAEVKSSSPSSGNFNIDPKLLLQSYVDAKADALSILSDIHFGMSIKEFQELADSVNLPVLRKDFILCREQILESYLLGADAVLLIASFLTEEQLFEFGKYAEELEMSVLYEIHSAEEISKLPGTAKIVGVNNRNLKDKNYKTDVNFSSELLKLLPKNALKIAESGFKKGDIVPEGYDALLIGEGLISEFKRNNNIADIVSKLKERKI